ncbi:hypothetical protein PLESTB_001836000 [Pleodorina starrii]|uniref:Uncharacterized protein n=1 Tax=Pleodorina starrii TaxID=330485 RepID=A0A9W6C1B8_9CHLO|nr:hypothetical protein PLESTB_001836000 [Pleodorina starrii]
MFVTKISSGATHTRCAACIIHAITTTCRLLQGSQRQHGSQPAATTRFPPPFPALLCPPLPQAMRCQAAPPAPTALIVHVLLLSLWTVLTTGMIRDSTAGSVRPPQAPTGEATPPGTGTGGGVGAHIGNPGGHQQRHQQRHQQPTQRSAVQCSAAAATHFHPRRAPSCAAVQSHPPNPHPNWELPPIAGIHGCIPSTVAALPGTDRQAGWCRLPQPVGKRFVRPRSSVPVAAAVGQHVGTTRRWQQKPHPPLPCNDETKGCAHDKLGDSITDKINLAISIKTRDGLIRPLRPGTTHHKRTPAPIGCSAPEAPSPGHPPATGTSSHQIGRLKGVASQPSAPQSMTGAQLASCAHPSRLHLRPPPRPPAKQLLSLPLPGCATISAVV